ncbi:hypothetical protein K474DRAFT_1360670 [Panus rudis PR-1116 ss-1]|nr:hypothetical protein K474DRAFT_1360670 [Panus rudis PR-1116 ss-1]
MDMSSASGSDCSTRPKSLQGTYTSGLFCLPSDVVLELLSMLTGPELGRLAATCKFFHEHMCHNSLWRTLCRYYGLRDLKYFPGVSFRTVYTRLLYPYGPLIGLWANDRHYNRLHRPGHHRQDMLPFSPVYYPVRMPAKEEGRLDPRTELSGIWWADGLPNPQFLYIDWVDTAFDDPSRGGAFMVWKLTGDLLIPRGELLAWLKRDERANSLTPRFEGRGVAITSEARGFSQIQTTATAKLVERDILLIYIAHQNTVLVNDPISCVRIDISNDPHDGGAWIVHS